MAEIRTIEGVFAAGEARFALVASRFNSFVVESLIAGAVDTLRRHGVADAQITLVRSPGAFELPLPVNPTRSWSANQPTGPPSPST